MLSLDKREPSSDVISLSDLGIRQNSYYNVPPTYESLNHRGETPLPKINSQARIVERVYDRLSFGSELTLETVNSEVPLVEVKHSKRPNLKKLCIITLVVLNVCTIIALSVALGIVANRADHKDDSGNGRKTTDVTLFPPTEKEKTTLTSQATEWTSVEAVTSAPTSTIVTTAKSSLTQGSWLPWGAWTDCTVTCGNGTYTRYRQCNNTNDVSANCQGNYIQIGKCTQTDCQVHGKWTSWSLWESCDVTCGGGTQTRTRSCVKTDDSNFDCIGDILQQQMCAFWDCPDCSKVCDEGNMNSACDMCVCNTAKTGVVVSDANNTISNATVYIGVYPLTVVAYTNETGIFSSDGVCNIQKLNVRKNGFSASNCLETASGVVCTLLKHEHPVFYKEPSPRARLVGESITLCCSADGNPDVKYYEWMKYSLNLDSSLYPNGTALELSDLTTSENGLYKCRANSDSGSAQSEEAAVIVKETEMAFCSDAFGQRRIHLPSDCIQPDTNTSSIETGYCNRQLCRKKGSGQTNSCKDENPNCCTISDDEVSPVQCSGYKLSVLKVKSCGCGDCNFHEVKLVGKVMINGTNEYVKFAEVYLNGIFKQYTNSRGSFKVFVDMNYGSAVISVISNFRQTTKVIDVSEGTTGTIYTDLYLLQAQVIAEIISGEDSVVYISSRPSEKEQAVAEIRIQPYSFMDKSFQIYDGIVYVSLSFINTSNVSDLDILPGLLISLNNEGEKQYITSSGAFFLSFYESLNLPPLKLRKLVTIYPSGNLIADDHFLYKLNIATGLLNVMSVKLPYELSGDDLTSWINIGKPVQISKMCFYNIRIYGDQNLISEVTNPKFQLFVQTVHRDGSRSYITYSHTFSPSRTCLQTVCDENEGFIEVWISNFEKEESDFLMPAHPSSNRFKGLSTKQQQQINYFVDEEDFHLYVEFLTNSDGPFFEDLSECLSKTFNENQFSFYFKDDLEDIFTLRHFFDLSSPNTSAQETISQRVWYQKRQEGFRVCFLKIKFNIQTNGNITVRAISYGGTNVNISGEILGIRQRTVSHTTTLCLEYKCSGTINEDFSDGIFDDTKVMVNASSFESVDCTVQSYSKDLIGEFQDLNPTNDGMSSFVFYAPRFYSPSLGIYSATTSSNDIESARTIAKNECRSGIPMDTSSENANVGTAVKFLCQ